MIVLALSIYLFKLLAGFLLIHLIWDSRAPKALVLKLFLGAGMGTGMSALFYFLWARLALPGRLYPFFELAILLTLIVIAWRMEPKENLPHIPARFALPSKRTSLWIGLLGCAILLCLANFLIESAALPHGIYDAWNIWNLGARFIYFMPDHWMGIVSQNAWDHADYPLLVTLNVADGWTIVGSNTTRIPAVFSLFFMLALIGLVLSSISITRNFEQGALAAIVISSLPMLVDLGSFQYADIQLSYFFLATATFLYLYSMQKNTKFLLLAGLFAGFAGWTKNEGNMFMVMSLLVCTLIAVKERKNLLKYFFCGLAFPVLIVVLFKQIAPASDLFVDRAKSFQQLFDISRYHLIFAQLWEKLLLFGYWPVSFFVILGVYALLMWKSKDATGKLWIPLCLFLFQFIGYFIIYLVTPHDLYWQMDTSLLRLIFHLVPLMMFWFFNLLPSPLEIFGEKSLLKQQTGLEQE